MIRSPGAIAWWVIRAHFPEVARIDAVALALILSGGDDTYQSSAGGLGPPTDFGLWALDPQTFPEVAGFDLTNGFEAAKATRLLYTAAGWPEQWGWAYSAPGWDSARLRAVQGVKAPEQRSYLPLERNTQDAEAGYRGARALLSSSTTDLAGLARAAGRL